MLRGFYVFKMSGELWRELLTLLEIMRVVISALLDRLKTTISIMLFVE